MLVKYYGRDSVSGTMRVSRKELVVGSAKAVKQLKRGVKSESKLLSKKGQEISQKTVEAEISGLIGKLHTILILHNLLQTFKLSLICCRTIFKTMMDNTSNY